MAFLTFVTQGAAVETGIRRGGGIDADEQGEEGGRDSEAHDVRGWLMLLYSIDLFWCVACFVVLAFTLRNVVS